MTSVLIIGGGGMIGQKLASSYTESETVSLLDMAFPENSNLNAKKILGSVTDTSMVERALSDLPDTIFYLASIGFRGSGGKFFKRLGCKYTRVLVFFISNKRSKFEVRGAV